MDISSIQIGNLIIGEPTTSLTDIFLSVISFILFLRVRDRMNSSFFYDSWRMFFLFMSISTGIGTFAHALNGSQAVGLFSTLWMGMIVASSISTYFAVQATIKFMNTSDAVRGRLHILNLIILVVFILSTVIFNDFEIFKIHAAAALLVIFVTHLVAWIRSHRGSGWIVSGMLSAFITVFIHSKQFSLSEWFNYKDISHVIMIMSLLFIYNGIRTMSNMLTLSVFRARMGGDAAR